jgi:hypothetical protein
MVFHLIKCGQFPCTVLVIACRARRVLAIDARDRASRTTLSSKLSTVAVPNFKLNIAEAKHRRDKTIEQLRARERHPVSAFTIWLINPVVVNRKAGKSRKAVYDDSVPRSNSLHSKAESLG